jgi:hypothetical protein
MCNDNVEILRYPKPLNRNGEIIEISQRPTAITDSSESIYSRVLLELFFAVFIRIVLLSLSTKKDRCNLADTYHIKS